MGFLSLSKAVRLPIIAYFHVIKTLVNSFLLAFISHFRMFMIISLYDNNWEIATKNAQTYNRHSTQRTDTVDLR